MYEKILTIETLEQIETTVDNLLKSTASIKEKDELTKSADGMLRLNGMRDRLAHGYFEIDIDVVFDTLKNDIPPLLEVIKQMKKDLITVSEK